MELVETVFFHFDSNYTAYQFLFLIIAGVYTFLKCRLSNASYLFSIIFSLLIPSSIYVTSNKITDLLDDKIGRNVIKLEGGIMDKEVNIVVKGIFTDENNKPLEGVKIFLPEIPHRIVKTDSSGYYKFEFKYLKKDSLLIAPYALSNSDVWPVPQNVALDKDSLSIEIVNKVITPNNRVIKRVTTLSQRSLDFILINVDSTILRIPASEWIQSINNKSDSTNSNQLIANKKTSPIILIPGINNKGNQKQLNLISLSEQQIANFIENDEWADITYNEDFLSIDDSQLRYMLVNAVKDQQDMIEFQAQKISDLDSIVAKENLKEELKNAREIFLRQKTKLKALEFQLFGLEIPRIIDTSKREKFTIFYGRTITPFSMRIFDRFSNLIYEATQANDSINKTLGAWDGRINAELIKGVYSYQIEVRHSDGEVKPFNGYITIL